MNEVVAEIDWDAELNNLPVVEKPKKQKGRAFAQGITFGFADELEAYLSTIGEDSEEYYKVLEEIRGNLEKYQQAHPVESASFEIVGAVAPAVIAAFASGGASLGVLGSKILTQFPKINNAVAKVIGTRGANTVVGSTAVGAAQGALTGAGQAEGDFGETMTDATSGGLSGAAIGGVLGGAGKVIKKGFDAFIDFARQTFGAKAAAAAQREVQRIAQERGISPDDAMLLIQKGQLLAENITVRDIMRKYRALGGEAAETLRAGLTDRPAINQAEVKDYISRTLGASADENLITKRMEEIGTLKEKAKGLYNSPMGKQRVPQPILLEMTRIFGRVPELFNDLKMDFRTRGATFPFELKDGKIIVKPNKDGVAELTIENAEDLRSNLYEMAMNYADGGKGKISKNLYALEDKLRGLIDNISEDTKKARATWREMSTIDEAFDKAQKNWKNDPNVDELSLHFANALDKGEKATQAFRLGILSKIKQQLQSNSRAGTIKKLLDDTSNMGIAMRDIFPDQNIDELVRRLSNAKESNEAYNAILGMSPTAITETLVKKDGLGMDIIDAATSGGLGVSAVRLLNKIIQKTQPGLSPKENNDVVKIMLSRDAEMVKRILSSEARYELLEDKLGELGSAIVAGLSRAGTTGIEPETVLRMPAELTSGMFGAGQPVGE